MSLHDSGARARHSRAFESAGSARLRPYRIGNARVGRWLPLAAVIALGAVAGLGVLAAGPQLALMGAAGVLLVVLAVTRPELVIVVVFALASGLLPTALNPFVSLPVGNLQASDLLLFFLLGLVVVRVVVEDGFDFRRTPLDAPLLLFFIMVLVGLGVAVIGFGVNFANATYEVRMLAYYLIFFPITNLVRTRAQITRLVWGLIVVALGIAVLMLVTSAVGTVPGYTESWALQEQGVARVFHPGFTAVYAGMMIVMAYSALGQGEPVPEGSGRRHAARSVSTLVAPGGSGARAPRARGRGTGLDRWREIRWLVIGVLALGLLSTLARNVLVSGAVSFALLFVVLRQRERLRLVEILAFITFLSAILVVGLLATGEAGSLLRYADLYLARIGRMFSSDIVGQGENLQPRWHEIQYAWQQLQAHPLLGIGLYNPYRPAFYRGEPPQLRHFLHNAYLALWLKTGLAGLLAFLWLSALYLKRAFQNWRRVGGAREAYSGAPERALDARDPAGVPEQARESTGSQNSETGRHDRLLRAAVVGSAVAFVGLLLSNFVAPSFVQPGSLAVFGVIFGINEAILYNR